ncbi:MAG: hypothetical protein GX133_05425 [Syntrophomonadaceae bacterium]|nr:hypothetical protein [Syntrophomonadaceae bacterium]
MDFTGRQREGSAISTIYIDRRFSGPPDSANGGYACGLLARYTGNPAEVTLHSPPRLDTPLTVTRGDDGQVFLMDGEIPVASGKPWAGEITVPDPPTLEQVMNTPADQDITERIWYHGCFVCGTERAAGDGLRIFANRRLAAGGLADIWVPDSSLADSRGLVPAEMIWAALDCPGAWVCQMDKARVVVLGRMAADISAPVPAGRPYIIMGWHISGQGRKTQSGTALYDASGQVLARSLSTWIELQTVPNLPG